LGDSAKSYLNAGASRHRPTIRLATKCSRRLLSSSRPPGRASRCAPPTAMQRIVSSGSPRRLRPRLRHLAWTAAAADIDRRPYHPWQDIEARQPLPARPVRAGGPWRTLQSEAGHVDARPMQDRIPLDRRKPLATHGRTIHRVIFNRPLHCHRRPLIPP